LSTDLTDKHDLGAYYEDLFKDLQVNFSH